MYKKFFAAALTGFSLFSFMPSSAQQKDYSIQAVNFTKVKLTDKFWLPRLKMNHTATIPASFERCDKTGRVKNFEMAAANNHGKSCIKLGDLHSRAYSPKFGQLGYDHNE